MIPERVSKTIPTGDQLGTNWGPTGDQLRANWGPTRKHNPWALHMDLAQWVHKNTQKMRKCKYKYINLTHSANFLAFLNDVNFVFVYSVFV